jgi:hypothetical protein
VSVAMANLQLYDVRKEATRSLKPFGIDREDELLILSPCVGIENSCPLFSMRYENLSLQGVSR